MTHQQYTPLLTIILLINISAKNYLFVVNNLTIYIPCAFLYNSCTEASSRHYRCIYHIFYQKLPGNIFGIGPIIIYYCDRKRITPEGVHREDTNLTRNFEREPKKRLL